MKSINIPFVSRYYSFYRWIGYFFIIFFICIIPHTLNATSDLKHGVLSKHMHIIVLDPGHGGQDTGARGPKGTFEKNVTLKTQQIIHKSVGNNF